MIPIFSDGYFMYKPLGSCRQGGDECELVRGTTKTWISVQSKQTAVHELVWITCKWAQDISGSLHAPIWKVHPFLVKLFCLFYWRV